MSQEQRKQAQGRASEGQARQVVIARAWLTFVRHCHHRHCPPPTARRRYDWYLYKQAGARVRQRRKRPRVAPVAVETAARPPTRVELGPIDACQKCCTGCYGHKSRLLGPAGGWPLSSGPCDAWAAHVGAQCRVWSPGVFQASASSRRHRHHGDCAIPFEPIAAMAARKLRFRVVYCSSEDEDFPASELNDMATVPRGWKTRR